MNMLETPLESRTAMPVSSLSQLREGQQRVGQALQWLLAGNGERKSKKDLKRDGLSSFLTGHGFAFILLSQMCHVQEMHRILPAAKEWLLNSNSTSNLMLQNVALGVHDADNASMWATHISRRTYGVLI